MGKKDEFLRHVDGFHKGGKTCPCCRKINKKKSRKLARFRLKRKDRKLFDKDPTTQ